MSRFTLYGDRPPSRPPPRWTAGRVLMWAVLLLACAGWSAAMILIAG